MKSQVNFIIIIIFFSISITQKAQVRETSKYPCKSDSIISSLIVHVNIDSVQSYIQSLENMGTRFMISPNRKNVANWIRDKFLLLGIENVRIDSVLCTTQIDLWNLHYDTTTWQYNVAATIPGLENPDNFLVIGAHYDDVVAPEGNPMILAPGADDNASGVSALFEIARVFNEYNYHPKNSIEFVAFAAEELMNFGNCGSEGYVNDAVGNGTNIQLMINNDMIANTNTDNWQIRISNYSGCEWLTDISTGITQSYTDIVPFVLDPASAGSADCRYFYQEGIPCVYFMEKDFNPFYHSINDLVANCELDYCAEAIKISLGVLVKVDYPLTGMQELNKDLAINAFPNPCKGKLHIKTTTELISNNLHYSISDLFGRVIMDKQCISQCETTLNLEHLSPGVYVLNIESSKTRKTSLISLHK